MAGSRVGRPPVQAAQCAPLLNTIEIKIIIAFAYPRLRGAPATAARYLLSPVGSPLAGPPFIVEDSRGIKNRERSLPPGVEGGSPPPFFLRFNETTSSEFRFFGETDGARITIIRWTRANFFVAAD